MLHRLEPVLRADLQNFLEITDAIAPFPELHPTLTWFARSPSDATPLGAYLQNRRQLRALLAPANWRLVVMSDTMPSTFDALSELRLRTLCQSTVPMSDVFPAHAAELRGFVVDRVVPCQLFEADEVSQLRARYGADLSLGSLAALPNNEWHVCLVRGRVNSTPWIFAVAHMDPRCFWSEVVERDMLTVGAYAELGFSFAESWLLSDLIGAGVVSAMGGRPPRTSLQVTDGAATPHGDPSRP